MSHLVKCENVAVGDRLRYLGRPLTVEALESVQDPAWGPSRVAIGTDGRRVVLHDGWTVWAMKDQK